MVFELHERLNQLRPVLWQVDSSNRGLCIGMIGFCAWYTCGSWLSSKVKIAVLNCPLGGYWSISSCTWSFRTISSTMRRYRLAPQCIKFAILHIESVPRGSHKTFFSYSWLAQVPLSRFWPELFHWMWNKIAHLVMCQPHELHHVFMRKIENEHRPGFESHPDLLFFSESLVGHISRTTWPFAPGSSPLCW